jgi:hypothetical protein
MRRVGLMMLALGVGFPAMAMAAEPKPAQSYEELLAKLQAGDTSIDYQALRFAYAETPDFHPDAAPAASKSDLIQAVRSGNLGDALGLANTILAVNYTDMDAHLASFLVYDSRGDKAKAEFHRAVLRGLMKSLTDTGDGMSEDSAIVVVSVAEEYSYLGLQGYQIMREGMAPSSSGPLAVVAVTTADNQGATVYFNIRRLVAKMSPTTDALPKP